MLQKNTIRVRIKKDTLVQGGSPALPKLYASASEPDEKLFLYVEYKGYWAPLGEVASTGLLMAKSPEKQRAQMIRLFVNEVATVQKYKSDESAIVENIKKDWRVVCNEDLERAIGVCPEDLVRTRLLAAFSDRPIGDLPGLKDAETYSEVLRCAVSAAHIKQFDFDWLLGLHEQAPGGSEIAQFLNRTVRAENYTLASDIRELLIKEKPTLPMVAEAFGVSPTSVLAPLGISAKRKLAKGEWSREIALAVSSYIARKGRPTKLFYKLQRQSPRVSTRRSTRNDGLGSE